MRHEVKKNTHLKELTNVFNEAVTEVADPACLPVVGRIQLHPWC